MSNTMTKTKKLFKLVKQAKAQNKNLGVTGEINDYFILNIPELPIENVEVDEQKQIFKINGPCIYNFEFEDEILGDHYKVSYPNDVSFTIYNDLSKVLYWFGVKD